MAILRGNKLVNDLPEKDRVAIGITLPLQKGNGGYFAQSYQTSEQIKSNIKNLILTQKGERLMHPDFGTDLYSALFNQNTDDLESEVERSIDRAVQQWMPYITIEEILIDQSNTNRDTYFFTVTLKFKVAGQQTLETVTFNINQ
jgi:phage baseplate assembly protein W